jgi:hypothetical protein
MSKGAECVEEKDPFSIGGVVALEFVEKLEP